MSFEVTTSFVQQYGANVMMLAQQKGSKLRAAVRTEMVSGKTAYYDQIGATAARRRTSRHSDTPRMDTPHRRRKVDLADFDWGDLIDREDQVRMLIDPTSSYAQAASMAMGRSMDEVIVDAMRGTAYTGEAGATAVALPAGQKVAVAATGLTVAKLRATKKLLDIADVDGERRYFACTSTQIDNLLGDTSVTSADFNTIKALVEGTVDHFMGFDFIRVDGLRADGTKILPFVTGSDRACMAWQGENVLLGIGQDMQNRISERADKNYATQVFSSMAIGATRMQEVAVVEVSCLE